MNNTDHHGLADDTDVHEAARIQVGGGRDVCVDGRAYSFFLITLGRLSESQVSQCTHCDLAPFCLSNV